MRFPALAALAPTLLLGACSPRAVLLGHEPSAEGGSGGEGGEGGESPLVWEEPRVVAELDISAAGPWSRILVGDVSGDGRPDIVTIQPVSGIEGSLPQSVAHMVAFELDQTRLWEVGTVDPESTTSMSDIPAQIYDIDGDGRNEVLAVMEDELRIFDGATGTLEVTRSLPDPDAHDAIIIANLSGRARPEELILKDRYQNLYAFDPDHQPLFAFAGAVPFFPWPFDWDGDGRDELMAGCNFLDDDGTLAWSCEGQGPESVDSIWAGDLDQDPTNGTAIVLGAGDTFAFDATGTLLWRVDTVEAQNVVIGDFRPELPGLEVAGLDRVLRGANGTDALFIISATGELLEKESRPEGSGWSTIVSRLRGYGSEHDELILAYGRVGAEPTLYDGELRAVATIPEGQNLVMAADVCGDGREELLAYSDSFVRVYANAPCPLEQLVTGRPRPQPKRLYNWTRYWGGEVP